MRMRPDLIVRRQQSAGRPVWIVKDPVSLRYFTFSGQEFAILRWLDEAQDLDDLRRKFEAAFPPMRVTPQRLQSFLAKLYESGLLIAVGPNHGQLLLERNALRGRRERWQDWSNVLALRFRGIDPDRFLSWIYPKLRWCFSSWFLGAALLLVVTALALLFTHAADFRRQLPELHTLLQPSNLFWLLAAFAGAKVLHEFGHALTCKHFGGECHEMGIMLLLFTPTLYCNVTDSWILRSRWQRIAVSAAGILVEIVLAAIAVIIWRFSQPGLVHTVALNTVVVCSVGTLLFNGNPLLRYDGYFVLADLIEMPNLWQESRAEVKRLLEKWFLVDDAVATANTGNRRPILAVYGVASIAYRAFVSVAILIFLYRLLTPRGFGILIPVIAASLVATALVLGCGAIWRFWRRPMAWSLFRPARLVATACAAAVGIGAILTVSLPCQISGPGLLQPVAAQRIYATTPGFLDECVAPGESVAAGQVLARLDDPQLRRGIERLTGDERVVAIRVKNLQARLNDEPDVAAQLEVAQEILSDVRQQLAHRQLDAKSLVLISPSSGVVMEPPVSPSPPAHDQNLPTWTGTPVDPQNQDCFLERGTLICLVGNPADQEADVMVNENDVQYVRLGQRVRLQFAVAPTAILSGRVAEISKRNIATVPNELVSEQELASRPDAAGSRRPIQTSYSIRVALDECEVQLLSGALGRAKIKVEPQTIAQRMLRAIRRTFTVPM
jgi:putative peptide zinc metalloprotease protein